jgi:hypothetical protein
MRLSAVISCLMALALTTGCAVTPEFKTFHLSRREWRGTALAERGRIVVADAVAGAAPQTVTVIEIGGVLGLPSDPDRRMRILDGRARTVAAELERRGVTPADVGVEVRPLAEGTEREPQGLLLVRRFVIVVHEW